MLIGKNLLQGNFNCPYAKAEDWKKAMLQMLKSIGKTEFISYLEVSAYKAIGEHGSIKVKGIIDVSLVDEYLTMMEKDVWVKIILNSESINTIFFQGIVKTHI